MTGSSEHPLERAKRFRDLAAQARRDAERTHGPIRDAYLTLEKGWLQLAGDVEAGARRRGENEEDALDKQAALRPPAKSAG